MVKLICFGLLMAFMATPSLASDEASDPADSAYLSLGDPMVLNLTNNKRLTFLQISADVLIGDASEESTIKTHIPAIRHSLIMALSDRDAKDIKSPQKREEIRQKLTADVKTLIADLSGSEAISDILFSDILVQ